VNAKAFHMIQKNQKIKGGADFLLKKNYLTKRLFFSGVA